jgi:hypothetical protein
VGRLPPASSVRATPRAASRASRYSSRWSPRWAPWRGTSARRGDGAVGVWGRLWVSGMGGRTECTLVKSSQVQSRYRMLLGKVGHVLASDRRLGGEVRPAPLGHHQLVAPDVALDHLVAHLPWKACEAVRQRASARQLKHVQLPLASNPGCSRRVPCPRTCLTSRCMSRYGSDSILKGSGLVDLNCCRLRASSFSKETCSRSKSGTCRRRQPRRSADQGW